MIHLYYILFFKKIIEWTNPIPHIPYPLLNDKKKSAVGLRDVFLGAQMSTSQKHFSWKYVSRNYSQ